MAEYIEREAALEMIRKLRKLALLTQLNYYNAGVKDAHEAVKALPTADVAPIIRCRGCKYHGPTVSIYYCQKFGYITGDNDFCSYAESKGA